MLRLGIELRTVRVRHAADVARKLDDGALHAEAEAEERELVLARVLDGLDLALDAAVAEAARHEHALAADEDLVEIRLLVLDLLRVDPVDLHLRVICDAAMVQRLRDRDVGIGELDVLADDSDLDLFLRVVDLVDHLLPLAHIRGAVIHVEFLERDPVEALFLHHERHLVDRRGRAVLDDRLGLHIAEHRDLVLHLFGDGLLRAADEDVRLDADGAQFLDAVLRRLRLELAGRRDVRQQRHMDVERVVLADFLLHLADGLEERLALDVADRAADLCDDDIGAVRLRDIVDALLDLVRDVRDDLHRRTEVLAAALLRQHGPVDLARRDVGVLREVDIDEPLVMAKVEIRLSAVVRHEDLAVLVRAHRPRIDVDVRIEFLNGHLDAPAFQETAERSRRNAFAEGRYNTAGNENILCHCSASCSERTADEMTAGTAS